MSKITKRQLHNGWYCHDTEIIKMKKELRELKQSVLRLEKLTDEKLLDEPQLKQLDQSVFDGLDDDIICAVVKSNGEGMAANKAPFLTLGGESWGTNMSARLVHLGAGYDTSNWQSSLIERDIAKEPVEVDLSSELTGSDLCRAMLARGDKYVMCVVGALRELVIIDTLEGGKFYSFGTMRINPIPINNQGEPLTASEVGL